MRSVIMPSATACVLQLGAEAPWRISSAQLGRQGHDLVEADAALVAGVVAGVAAGALHER